MMDLHYGNYLVHISIALFTLVCPSYTQRIACPAPCEIGFTCAMVRTGSRHPEPGCISMREALLLQQALDGGPSGPGTGISTSSRGMSPRFPPPQPPLAREIIPGMNMLGIRQAPVAPGFRQRFAQGINGQPVTMFNQQQHLVDQGFNPGVIPGVQGPEGLMGIGPASGFRGMGVRPGSFMPSRAPFTDPVTGQGIGGFGLQQADGGLTHSSTHALESNARRTGAAGGVRVGGVGNVNVGFPGENSHISSSMGSGLISTRSAPQTPAVDPQLEAIAERFNVTEANTTFRPERHGQVSTIQEDTFGMFYMFYPRVGSSGIRVNFTKSGFCPRSTRTPERNICMNMCYSDDQCPRDLKCCPGGCSLGCLRPFSPEGGGQTGQNEAPPTGTRTSTNAVEARCQRCETHIDCPGQSFCAMSGFCGHQLVCQAM